ncbi:MAG: MarR family winged helix-turn-helix transcriptional regulator [Amphiplicatus sp.]
MLAWVRLIRAQRVVLGGVEADLKAAGFPPLVWYDALLELRRAGGALPLAALEERMLLAQYNVSRLADRLAAAGYARKSVDAADARSRRLAITPAGYDLLDSMWPVYAAALRNRFAAALSERQARALAGLLGRIVRLREEQTPRVRTRFEPANAGDRPD